ncbi:TetR family transcriptional regulator [Luteibacter rhizovicinus DSM 16549]|uniref:TetR family transcriptional regulator n=1 Tax=Luteibacter rhizovicinus DSM 16549 TaxID=1440763 RepID=A0A0G9HB00_9GAMM|nr:TetR/AcrR family transcriptional regulator [Luteibacter rhizovicinus]APG04130.1 TetR family transcriptional regulator [Luteibacter rhizovicinus DSM 16549]KLD66798.1 transcriptional regulator [Luteibacter rhizovicinus DSM 16549]KLD76282.1 transcriptional regulator [Xanthomonas hyacinthi DSM 19077]
MKASLGTIVREARELFRHHGYDGASMQDLATKVGLKKASLYTRFPTKEALVPEVLTLTNDELFVDLPAGDPLAAYALVLERIARGLSEQTRCVGLHLAYGASGPDTPEAALAVRGFFTGQRERLAALIAPSVGETRARELAGDAIARLEGATVWTVIEGDAAPMGRALRLSVEELASTLRR